MAGPRRAAADYAETWVYLWNVPMPADDEDARLHWKRGVPTAGLQLISTGHLLVDAYMAFDADEFAQLGTLTGDRHYLDGRSDWFTACHPDELRGYELHFLPTVPPRVYLDHRDKYALDRPQTDEFLRDWRGAVAGRRTETGYTLELSQRAALGVDQRQAAFAAHDQGLVRTLDGFDGAPQRHRPIDLEPARFPPAARQRTPASSRCRPLGPRPARHVRSTPARSASRWTTAPGRAGAVPLAAPNARSRHSRWASGRCVGPSSKPRHGPSVRPAERPARAPPARSTRTTTQAMAPNNLAARAIRISVC